MNPTPETERRERLLARRRRHIRVIRRRAVAGSVAAFAAAWAVIGFQLVAGHDPALSKSRPAAAVSSNSSSASKKSARKKKSVTRSTSTPSSSTQLAPVTTQQS